MNDRDHIRWMQRAVELADKGRFGVSPNPLVGSCVVRGGKLVGQGFHTRFGDAHAEVQALRKAGTRSRGATLYTTLEPCATWGKTPPCVDAIVESGVREVIIGALDPNPKNHRQGVRILKNRSIPVQTGVLKDAIMQQNEWFYKFMTKKLPFVTLKMAQTLDGKIATRTGRSRWISSKPARTFVHQLRAEQDAVMVGKNTLLLDDPLLSPRIRTPGLRSDRPWRIAVLPDGNLRRHARILTGKQTTILAVGGTNAAKRLSSKGKTSMTVLPVASRRGRLDLRDLLQKLASLGVAKLLVEGGGETAWSLIREGLVDRVLWIVAPKVFGGANAKTSVEGLGVVDPADAPKFCLEKSYALGDDWVFETRLKQR